MYSHLIHFPAVPVVPIQLVNHSQVLLLPVLKPVHQRPHLRPCLLALSTNLNMCTTHQVLFLCSHQATHRFRTAVCRNANRGGCGIYDETEVLSYPCKNCAALMSTKGPRRSHGDDRRWRKPRPLPTRLLNASWYVPSRCFVDVGFQTLDPFGVGVHQEDTTEPQACSQRAEISPLGWHREIVVSKSAVETAQQGSWKATRGDKMWSFSLCCHRASRRGGYEATRLEGPDERISGRIVDSFCESSL
jgi:hypothetical protein